MVVYFDGYRRTREHKSLVINDLILNDMNEYLREHGCDYVITEEVIAESINSITCKDTIVLDCYGRKIEEFVADFVTDWLHEIFDEFDGTIYEDEDVGYEETEMYL